MPIINFLAGSYIDTKYNLNGAELPMLCKNYLILFFFKPMTTTTMTITIIAMITRKATSATTSGTRKAED